MLSPTAEWTAGKTGQQHNSMLLRGKGDHVMTCLQPSKASWLCNNHPGCLTGGILSPTDKPGAPEQVLAIVHACPPTKPASCICVIAFCMTFSSNLLACVSHPVCCRNVTTAIFGLVGRPPAASGSQTRLRLELVSCGRLPSTHSWSLLICAAVCGVFCDRLWLSEMRVWGVGMRESWEEIVMRLWRLGDGNE